MPRWVDPLRPLRRPSDWGQGHQAGHGLYYRCTMYNHGDHPQVGLREQQINDQVLVLFARLKQEDTVRVWFTRRIREWATEEQQASRENISHRF